jgi:hypothetical protein
LLTSKHSTAPPLSPSQWPVGRVQPQEEMSMTQSWKLLAYSIFASLGLLSTLGGADAACAVVGTWQFFGIEGSSPGIKQVGTSVRNSANTGSVQINSFPTTGTAFRNNTSNVIQCTLTVAAGGSFTGSCSSFGVTPNSNGPATVSGNLALNACNLTGTINVAGEPPATTIQGGRINSNSTSGAGIATKGQGNVLYFTLIK